MIFKNIKKYFISLNISKNIFVMFFTVGLVIGILSLSFVAKVYPNFLSKILGNFASVFLVGGSPEINYQGKLTEPSGVAVPNADYNIRFKLYTDLTGGTPIWTETHCYSSDSGSTCDGSGTDNRVGLTSGLFSVMLGSINSLSDIDMNRVLYLGVEIGGTNSSPLSGDWDGEMTPRKRIGTVPSAFTAGKLNGVVDTQFIRNDTDNATSSTGAVLTLTQNGSGNILDLYSGASKVVTFLSNGNVGIGTTSPTASLQIVKTSTNYSTPAIKITGKSLAGTGDDIDGYGLYLSYNLSGNKQFVFADTENGNGVRFIGSSIDGFNVNYQDRRDLQFGTETNGAHVAGAVGNSQFSVNNLGGIKSKVVTEIKGAVSQSGNYFNISSSNNTGDIISILANGNVGIGTTTPSEKLSVAGNGLFTGTVTADDVLPNMIGGTGNVSLYNLGNTTNRWKSGWFETINIGTSTWSIKAGSDGRLSFFDSSSGAGNERLTINTDGNVELGGTLTVNNLNVNSKIGTDTFFENQPLTYNGRKVSLISPYTTKSNVYKGMMHDHSTNSDGKQTPSEVATSYRDAGYNFISITDHNNITSTEVSGILYIPGIEESREGHINIINAVTNISSTKLQTYIDHGNNEDSFIVLNHPDDPKLGLTNTEMESLQGYYGVEVWNSKRADNAESKIDHILSIYRKAYLIAGDDCHDVNASYCKTASVNVFANSLTTDEIMENLKRGNFYSSNGANISSINVSEKVITVTTDSASTIDFIVKDGVVAHSSSNTTSASYTVFGDEIYVRARVTRNSDGKMAWTNPIYVSDSPVSELASGGVIKGNVYVTGTSTFMTGFVGIGTLNPTHKLDIVNPGSSAITTDVIGIDINHTSAGSGAAISFDYSSNDYSSNDYSFAKVAGVIDDYSNNKGSLHFFTRQSGGITEKMVITSNGNVGIGTTNPTANLTALGTIRFSSLGSSGANLTTDSLGNVSVSSDERLKDIQGDYERGLSDIMKINPIRYKWKPETGYDTFNTYSGFSAQNMFLAIPEAVATSTAGYLTLADRPVIAVLVNSVKQIGSFISRIQDGIAYLRNIAVETLQIGSQGKPSGITMYDESTGDPYCVKIIDGVLVNEDGECSVVVSSDNIAVAYNSEYSTTTAESNISTTTNEQFVIQSEPTSIATNTEQSTTSTSQIKTYSSSDYSTSTTTNSIMESASTTENSTATTTDQSTSTSQIETDSSSDYSTSTNDLYLGATVFNAKNIKGYLPVIVLIIQIFMMIWFGSYIHNIKKKNNK